MTDQELIDNLKILLKPIQNQIEEMDLKISNMDLKISNMDLKIETMRLENKTEHRAIRKDIERLNDEMETVVAALRAKDILPIAK